MIDYLKDYNLTDEDINEIKKTLSNEIIDNLSLIMENATEVLNYLKEIGVNNFKEFILVRNDLCCYDVNYLKSKFEQYDINLIVFIINNNIEDLINFDI